MAKVTETVEKVLESEEVEGLSCEISFGAIEFHQTPSGCILWPLSEIDDLIKFLQEEKARLGGEAAKEVK